MPNVWRYVPFDTIIEMTARLAASPLSDSPDAAANVQLFRRNSSIDGSLEVRKFIDWRKAFTILVLMSGKIPTYEELNAYYGKLRAVKSASANQVMTKADFVGIEAWFDKSESATIPVAALGASPSAASPQSLSHASPLEGQTSEKQIIAGIDASFDDDEDEAGDWERLETVKTLLFDTYRVQNREGLDLDCFISDLDFIFKEQRSSDSDERTLYHTQLNMPQ